MADKETLKDQEKIEDEEKVEDLLDSITSLDFNPIANSTMNTSTPQRQKPDLISDAPQPEKDSEPPPFSVCFADPLDGDERPIGPMQNYDKIVSETQDLTENLLHLMLKQRRFLLVCAYQISSLNSILEEHYHPLLKKMDTFLTNCDRFQTEWFFQYYRMLPTYAEYSLVLEDSQEKVEVDEIPNLVKESTLKVLAEDVVNNMFAGGLQVKFQRSLNVDMSLKMEYREEAFGMEDLPLQLWMDLFDTQSENANKIGEYCFELLSIIDLLNFDDNLKSKRKNVRFEPNTTV